MNKKINSLLLASMVALIVFSIMMVSIFVIYFNSRIEVYHFLLQFVMIILMGMMLTFLTGTVLVYYALCMKMMAKSLVPITFFLVHLLSPFVLWIASHIGLKSDSVKGILIDVNNILVKSGNLSFQAKEVLLIVPHCLQYHQCVHKVTHNTANCKKCGKCSIGNIVDLANSLGIGIEIVTGGTAARNTIKKIRPHFIVAVACERDLFSGIMDIGRIPVLGLVNKRPNGPCFDTEVDLEILRDTLLHLVKN